jgi:hypothetical protein
VEAEIAGATPERAAALREYTSVEYPPLAVLVMVLPALVVDDPFVGDYPTGLAPRYARAYMGLMAVFDVLVLLIVVRLIRRLYPDESPGQQGLRSLFYLVASWPLYAVLYARLDLGLALAVTAALALLVGRRFWVWSFLVLALGIHFKLMPMVLAPLWVIGALPVSALHGSWPRMLRLAAVRVGVLAGFCVAIFGIFYVWQGPAILDFLGYHKDRGLEIESTWSGVVFALQPFGSEWQVYHSHGSVNVRSSLTPALCAAATASLAVLLLAATAAFVVVARRRLAAAPQGGTVAQAQPRLVAGFALLLLLLSIVANKVYSPQYLLWVLPLVALVQLPPVPRRLFYGAVLVVCYLTMRIFPDCFVGEIVYVVGRDGELALFDGPTTYGALLLLTRNALTLALTGWLGWSLVRPPVPANAYLPRAAAPPTIPSTV